MPSVSGISFPHLHCRQGRQHQDQSHFIRVNFAGTFVFSCVVSLHRSEDRFNHGRRLLLEAALLNVLSMLFNRIWCRNRRWLCIWRLALLERLTDKQNWSSLQLLRIFSFFCSCSRSRRRNSQLRVLNFIQYTDLRTSMIWWRVSRVQLN